MISEIVFGLLVVVTLAGAFGAVALKRIFYNILSLIVALFGLACLFIYLNSEFIAVMQVIVYIGAIGVAMIFAIMLSAPAAQTPQPRNPRKIFKAAAVGLLLFAGLVRILWRTTWPSPSVKIDDFSAKHLGELLLAQYPLAFEAISLVLLVAILGAILISRDVET
ncbi:MAG: NADH-quinone oxidoreductase subunit J [Candidatus Omnitrophica bacterium]|nr:NADH-quinone oxidoreductase subunit J [Candidatus Omnitrophota bacterium]